MRLYYDLHIHSCLSPCGDDDMTPNNIANMAKLSGLDLIALTDHNSCRNAPALIEAARRIDLLALAGMELTTREDVHIVMLFASLENALEFNDFVDTKRMRVKNREEIYGRQLILDSDDEIVASEPDLLITATDIGVYETAELASRYGGVAFPAHIDRESNGLVAVLGALERDMRFGFAEFSSTASAEFVRQYEKEGYFGLHNSDAHRLENISEKGEKNFIDLKEPTAKAVIEFLKKCG